MSADVSALVSGSAINNYCKKQAAYLCKLIYRDPVGSQAFSTYFPEEVAKAAATCDE